MIAWKPGDTEPSGWFRHPTTNRYRVRCDPGQEFCLSDDPPEGFDHPFHWQTGWTRKA